MKESSRLFELSSTLRPFISVSRTRFALVATIALLLLALAASVATAHETEQPYAYMFIAEDKVDGRLELAISDVGDVLGLDLSGSDVDIEEELRSNQNGIVEYADAHYSVGADGQEWQIKWGRIDLFREGSSSLAFAVVQYQVDVPDAVVPPKLEVKFDPFFDEIDGRDGLLLVSGGWPEDVYSPDAELLRSFTTGSRSQTVDLGGESAYATVRSGVTLGVDHIRTGPDHILFVLALLLPSVLVYRQGWEPAQGFLTALWRVLKIASFFTIAHSVTFTMAGMGWLPLPPSKLTEAIIAGSIAAAGLHNLRPVLHNREWLLAFVFGLFHGMGFASLVSGLDVSRSSQLLSLLGRNIGIEIGQVIVILLLFPALYLLRPTRWYQPFFVIGSLVMVVLALGWMIERLFEIDLGTNGVVDSFASTPNGYIVAAVFTLFALAASVMDRSSTTPSETSSKGLTGDEVSSAS